MHLTESHCQLVTDEVSSWVARMASRTDRTKATSKDQSLAISVDQCKDLVQWCCQIKWSSLLINISKLCWPSLHIYLLEHIWLSSCVPIWVGAVRGQGSNGHLHLALHDNYWLNHVITSWHSVTNLCIVYYSCISSIIKNQLTSN